MNRTNHQKQKPFMSNQTKETRGARKSGERKTWSVPADAKAESAILWTVWTGNNQAMLERLDPQDFGDPLNRCIFEEFRMMAEVGIPLGDSVASARWFSGPLCSHRISETLKIKRSAAEIVADKLIDFQSEYVTAAHDEYYFRILRIERLRRGFQQVGMRLIEKIEDQRDEPWQTIEWLQANTNALWALAHELFGEEMDA